MFHCVFPYFLLLQSPCTESHRCMMLGRRCPRRRYHPVKAQVSQQLWTEVNLSASPTSPPHSHTWPVSSVCVCVCVSVPVCASVCVRGSGRECNGGRAFPWLGLRTLFLLWIRPRRTSPFFLSSLALPSSASSSLSPAVSTWMGWMDSEVAEFLQHGRTYEHGMPSDSSETVRISVNSTCFTATLVVVLCLLTVHSRNLPLSVMPRCGRVCVTFRSIFYTTVHQLCSGIETV